MKAITKLNKIMAMDDSPVKETKLFLFCCSVLPHCQLWETANKEWERLFRMYRK